MNRRTNAGINETTLPRNYETSTTTHPTGTRRPRCPAPTRRGCRLRGQRHLPPVSTRAHSTHYEPGTAPGQSLGATPAAGRRDWQGCPAVTSKEKPGLQSRAQPPAGSPPLRALGKGANLHLGKPRPGSPKTPVTLPPRRLRLGAKGNSPEATDAVGAGKLWPQPKSNF